MGTTDGGHAVLVFGCRAVGIEGPQTADPPSFPILDIVVYFLVCVTQDGIQYWVSIIPKQSIVCLCVEALWLSCDCDSACPAAYAGRSGRVGLLLWKGIASDTIMLFLSEETQCDGGTYPNALSHIYRLGEVVEGK
jgi:hypothetical protein